MLGDAESDAGRDAMKIAGTGWDAGCIAGTTWGVRGSDWGHCAGLRERWAKC